MNQIEELAMILEENAIEEDFIIVSVDSLSSFSLMNFKEKYPEKVIELGICEFSSIAISYGISLTNKKVFIIGFSSFLINRGLEAIRNYLGYNQANVCILGGMSGVSHAKDGYMHQSYDDIGIVRSLESINIYTPSDNKSLRLVMNRCFSEKKPAFVRLYRVPIEMKECDRNTFVKDSITRFNEGKEILIISYGHVVQKCQETAEKLLLDGIKSTVLDFYKIYPITNKILDILSEYKFVFIVEDHLHRHGLFDEILNLCAKYKHEFKNINEIAIDSYLAGQSGTVSELMRNNNLNTESIYKRIAQEIANDKNY